MENTRYNKRILETCETIGGCEVRSWLEIKPYQKLILFLEIPNSKQFMCGSCEIMGEDLDDDWGCRVSYGQGGEFRRAQILYTRRTLASAIDAANAERNSAIEALKLVVKGEYLSKSERVWFGANEEEEEEEEEGPVSE